MKNTKILVIAISILLGACAPEEKAPTVSEFLHDPALLKKTITFCTEDPASRMQSPTCINGKEAYNKKILMSEFGHCFKNGEVVSHQCIDDYLNK